MYTEEKSHFPMRDLILKMLFLALFVFLLMWLFPMVKNPVDLSPLTDRIFNDNINNMKEAAKAYYINERLPINVGGKVSMHLEEMLDKKLILPFVDSKGHKCDPVDSYVEITKMDNEYILKTYLVCGKQADYLIEHMGCYDKCPAPACVEEEEPVAKEKPVVKEKTKQKEITEYRYRRSIDTSYWTAYGDWTEQYQSESDTVKRIEKTLVRGKKWVSNPTYEYEHTRTIEGQWSPWSTWSETPVTKTSLRDVEQRNIKTKTVYSDWSAWSAWGSKQTISDLNLKQEQTQPVYENRVTYGSWYYYKTIYSVTKKTTYIYTTEKMFAHPTTPEIYGSDPNCGGCNPNYSYYVYIIYKRNTNTTKVQVGTLYSYRTRTKSTVTIPEYRYRTRDFVTKSEYLWSLEEKVSGWSRTKTTPRLVSDNGGWVYTEWLTTLPDGYQLYATKKLYAYSYKKVSSRDEYKWSTELSIPGWVRTGEKRTRLITI